MNKFLKKYAALAYLQHHAFRLQNFIFFLFPVVLAIIAFLGISVTGKAVDSPAINLHKYYTSIQIQTGDSLWSIAEKYMTPEYKSKKAYIKEVMQLNHLTSYEIHAGGSLVVPYYR